MGNASFGIRGSADDTPQPILELDGEEILWVSGGSVGNLWEDLTVPLAHSLVRIKNSGCLNWHGIHGILTRGVVASHVRGETNRCHFFLCHYVNT
jgi:hypothetical protein